MSDEIVLADGEVVTAGWRPRAVHELAEVFPMMPEDELADLAADIKANGLHHPIVIDAEGALVDGRNRLAACELAGVEPVYARLNGHDPAAFIVSTNIARRNLTKGQQAIALALIYPEPEKAYRGKKSAAGKVLESKAFSPAMLSQARNIVRYSRALALQVRDAAKPFDEALQEVKAAEQKGRSAEHRLAELRRRAPDVAALVADERITLEAGVRELELRQQSVTETLEAARRAVAAMLLVPAQVSIIRTALLLTDEDLALLDLTRSAADPFAEVDREVRNAVKAAAAEFATMKPPKQARED